MTSFYLTLAGICHSFPPLRRLFWRYVYQRMARQFSQRELIFMNYGFDSSETRELQLAEEDEPYRSVIALYHHVASATDLDGKELLEVGCGRGGGASYVARYLKPSQMTGVDISHNAVRFCSNRHPVDALTFQQGDAESLPFEDESFDAVLNVESSHCYGSIDRFIGEVSRVLRPGGEFLYADFRPAKETAAIRQRIVESRLTIEEEEDITSNVLKALESDSAAKEAWISELAGEGLQETLRTFAATEGTKLYRMFVEGDLVYFRYRARKG